MICRSAEAEARIDEYARRLFHEFYKKPLDRELLNRFAAEITSTPTYTSTLRISR